MPSESSLESIDFSLVSVYHLDIASGLEIRACFHFSFQCCYHTSHTP